MTNFIHFSLFQFNYHKAFDGKHINILEMLTKNALATGEAVKKAMQNVSMVDIVRMAAW